MASLTVCCSSSNIDNPVSEIKETLSGLIITFLKSGFEHLFKGWSPFVFIFYKLVIHGMYLFLLSRWSFTYKFQGIIYKLATEALIGHVSCECFPDKLFVFWLCSCCSVGFAFIHLVVRMGFTFLGVDKHSTFPIF